MEQLAFDLQTIPGKTCTKCGVWKPLDRFHKHTTSRYGRNPKCKECRQKEWRRPPSPATIKKRQLFAQGLKRCAGCDQVKSLSDFYKYKRSHDGLTYRCKGCRNAYTYEYRIKNPEVIKACDRRYHARHHEEIKARQREYNKRRRPKKLETIERESLYEQGLRRCGKCKQIKAFSEFHKRSKEYNRHRSICKKCDQAQSYMWAHNNPDKVKAAKIKRRTRKSGAGGSYTTEEWQALCEQYDNRCLCCGEEKPLTHDHIIPINKGGHSNISNLQPLCHSCNCKKHTKIIDYR